VLLAIALAAGLLTKAYFLGAIPAVVLVLGWELREISGTRMQFVFASAVALLAAFLVAAPFYWRLHYLTASFSGEESDILAQRVSWTRRIPIVLHGSWGHAIRGFLSTHLYVGGMSFLVLPKPWYFFGAGVLALAAAGILVLVLRDLTINSGDAALAASERKLLVFFCFFLLAMAYHAFVVLIAKGTPEAEGWYIYSLVVAEIALLYRGLTAVFPSRLKNDIPLALAAWFGAMDLYGLHFQLLPYYTGITTPDSGGRVRALSVVIALRAPWREMLGRLTANRCGAITYGFVFCCWIAYIFSTAITLIIAFMPLRASNLRADGPTAQPGMLK
jgi:hypothetical protein